MVSVHGFFPYQPAYLQPPTSLIRRLSKMKKMLSNYALGSLACIVMGVALIINPHIITDVLNTALGVILIVWASVGILRFIIAKSKGSDDAGIFSLFGDLILLAAGIYVFVNTSLLETIAMTALGLYLLCSGLPKLINSFKLKRISPQWKTPLISSGVTALLGIAVLIMPNFIAGRLMRLVGVILAIAGFSGFISGSSSAGIQKKYERSNKKKNKVYDVKYKED